MFSTTSKYLPISRVMGRFGKAPHHSATTHHAQTYSPVAVNKRSFTTIFPMLLTRYQYQSVHPAQLSWNSSFEGLGRGKGNLWSLVLGLGSNSEMPSFQEFHTTPHPDRRDITSPYPTDALSAFSTPAQEATPSHEENPTDNDTNNMRNPEELDNDVDDEDTDDESDWDVDEYDDEEDTDDESHLGLVDEEDTDNESHLGLVENEEGF